MIKERELLLSRISVAIQLILTIFSFLIANYFFPNSFGHYQNWTILGQIVILYLPFLISLKLGFVFRNDNFTRVIRNYFLMITLGTVLVILEALLLKSGKEAYFFILLFSILNLISLVGFKYIFRTFMRFIRRKGRNARKILIIADETSKLFIHNLLSKKDWGYQIYAIMDSSGKLYKTFPSMNYIAPTTDLKLYLDQNIVDEVFFAKPITFQSEISVLKNICNEIGVVCHISNKLSIHKDIIDDLTTYQNTPKNYFQLKLKSFFDYYFSLMVLIAISPVLLLIALSIKIEDGGAIFFKQERVGLNGRRFKVFKFRTMVENAEELKSSLAGMNEQEGPVFKIKSDPRVTKVGKFLRETSLDELPQFINVLKGEMSVVGPRPPIPAEVEQYQRWQLRRLSMKPGITCIWQVSGRNDVKFDEWMKMDMDYIDHWSFTNDLKLIVQTVMVVFKRSGQ